jgi:hypothetical protein
MNIHHLNCISRLDETFGEPLAMYISDGADSQATYDVMVLSDGGWKRAVYLRHIKRFVYVSRISFGDLMRTLESSDITAHRYTFGD